MTEITEELREKALGIIPAPISEYEGELFVIVESWEVLSDINLTLNIELAEDEFGIWEVVYLETGDGRHPFSDLRLGHRQMSDGSVQRSADLCSKDVKPPYAIPDGLIELGDICGWGFSDEYSACCECNSVVRTSPDCYAWTPDCWDVEYGYICGNCVRADPDEYLEDRVQKGLDGELVACNLIEPGEYGFRLIAFGLESGMHEHQNDDPRAVVQWAVEHNLQCVFVVGSSQFSQSFDVWMRHEDGGSLFDSAVIWVKEALLEGETEYSCHLRGKFRQYPTPASLIKQSLEAASAAGERFVSHHGDGSYTAYETAEEMVEAMKE